MPEPTPDNTLPLPLTSLIGREQDIAALCHLLSQEGGGVRLLTLIGAAGSGKTRLAIRVGASLAHAFPDGVRWVDLSLVIEARLISQAVANALPLPIKPQDEFTGALAQYLQPKRLLLIIDNCEHLIDGCAELAQRLLNSCPGLQILATSRESLKIPGETIWLTPLLAIPRRGSVPPFDELLGYPGIRLWVERATAAFPEFRLTPENAPAVVQVCQRLDGMPLAIELAAARLKYDSLPNLLASLSAEGTGSSLALLKAELQDVPERQRSLWATIAWSYNLLDGVEQKLFRRLSVFVGGWTGEAAQAVAGEGLSLAVEDGLRRLMDANLIFLDQRATTGSRFGMLETIREFGLAQLQATGELLSTQHAHALFYRNLVERLEPDIRSAAQTQTETYLRAEYPNIRSALTWAIGQGEVDISLSLCDCLHTFWNSHAAHEALPLIEPALAVAEATPPSVAYVHALVSAGYFAYIHSRQPKGRRYFENALAMNEAIGGQGSGF